MLCACGPMVAGLIFSGNSYYICFAIIIVLFAILKPRLSMDRPGKLQHTFELAYDFLHEQASEQVGHDGHKYLAFFGTIFFFILSGHHKDLEERIALQHVG